MTVALVTALALPGCNSQTSCQANADCPAQRYCVLADGGAQGTCRRDCEATADCGDPALRCSSLGQCIAVEIPLVDAGADAAPDDAAPADDAAPDDAAASD
jgi:hypothetical protein